MGNTVLAKDIEFSRIFAVLEFLPDQLAIKRIARFSSRNQCDQFFSLFHRCPIYKYIYIYIYIYTHNRGTCVERDIARSNHALEMLIKYVYPRVCRKFIKSYSLGQRVPLLWNERAWRRGRKKERKGKKRKKNVRLKRTYLRLAFRLSMAGHAFRVFIEFTAPWNWLLSPSFGIMFNEF